MALADLCNYDLKPSFEERTMNTDLFSKPFAEIFRPVNVHDGSPGCSKLCGETNQEPQQNIPHDGGTTTIGFKYNNGIIVAADSRTTLADYISSKNVKKVIEINRYMLATIAGGAADCRNWCRILSLKSRMYEYQYRNKMKVSLAAKLSAETFQQVKKSGLKLSMHLLLAGWNGANEDPALYFVAQNGRRLEGNVFATGSGSPYAVSILESGYKWCLDDEEAVELANRAIYHSTYRDSMSGGMITVYQISCDGSWEKVAENDCFDLRSKYAPYQKTNETFM